MQKSYVYAFYSRNAAMLFYDTVSDRGVNAKLVNTPRIAGNGCGLSVRCDDRTVCDEIINLGRYTSLTAVYSFDGREYTKLY